VCVVVTPATPLSTRVPVVSAFSVFKVKEILNGPGVPAVEALEARVSVGVIVAMSYFLFK
jgi:hypothetical protein